MQTSFSIFQNKNSRWIFAGQCLSQICDKMMSVGLAWVLIQEHSVSAVSWFLAISAIPHLLFAFKAGEWTQKIGIVRTLFATDLIRGILFLGLALCWNQIPTDWHFETLVLFSFLANCAGALYNPVIFSAPAFLVETSLLQGLNALLNSCFYFANVLGPVLSVALYPLLGLQGFFVINAISYIIAAWTSKKLKIQTPQVVPENSPTEITKPKSMKEILAQDSMVSRMMAGFLFSNLFLAPLIVFLPAFVKAKFDGGIQVLSQLELALGLGTVLGALVLSSVQFQLKLGKKLALGMSAVALLFLGFSLTAYLPLSLLFILALGFFMSTVNVFSLTFFQTRTAEQDIPTLMSLVNLISVATFPLTLGILGFVMKSISVNTVAVVCAVGLCLVTVLVIANRKFLNLG